MKRLSLVIFSRIAVVALAVLLLGGWAGASAAGISQHLPSTSSTSTCGVWTEVSSPNAGTNTNFLNGVSAISPTNIWAVGTADNFALVDHWDGIQWKVVTSPTVTGSLSGVAAISTHNIWAVGASGNFPLVEHWDGAQWNVVTSPTVTGSLSAIAALSAHNIWAVGNYIDASNNQQSLIEHWNGSTWSVVPGPGTGQLRGQLSGVAAISAHDIWAVGYLANPIAVQTLIEHWNGTTWSVVKSSGPGLVSNTLTGVAAISTHNVWAVGNETNSVGPYATFTTLIEHWNGTSWSVVPSPLQGTSDLINGIAAVSASNVWMVGDYRSGIDPQGPYFTLIEHWNGTTWSVVKSPSPGAEASDLVAAARVPKTKIVWTVGFNQDTPYTSQTLTAFYCKTRVERNGI